MTGRALYIFPLALLFALLVGFLYFSHQYLQLSFYYMNASSPKQLESFFQTSLNSLLALFYAVLFFTFAGLILIVYYVLGLARLG